MATLNIEVTIRSIVKVDVPESDLDAIEEMDDTEWNSYALGKVDLMDVSRNADSVEFSTT